MLYLVAFVITDINFSNFLIFPFKKLPLIKFLFKFLVSVYTKESAFCIILLEEWLLDVSQMYTQPNEIELHWFPDNLCLYPAFGKQEWSHYVMLPVSSQCSQFPTSLKPHFQPVPLFVLSDQSPKLNCSSSLLTGFGVSFWIYFVKCPGLARKEIVC